MKNNKSILVTTLLACLFGLACVTNQLREAHEANAELAACVRQHESEPERCNHLRSEASRRFDKYESDAKEETRDWREASAQ